MLRIFGLFVLRCFDWLVQVFVPDRSAALHDDGHFRRTLTESFAALRQEYAEHAQGQHLADVKDFFRTETDLQDDDKWKAAPILLFNHRFPKNIQRYPETWRLVQSLPGVTSAMISVLMPGKRVPLHRGIYKGIYRCLYTIYAAEGEVWIELAGDKKNFRPGEYIVFDETVEHQLFNNTREARVALYLDIYRELPFPLNWMNYILFRLLRRSPFITNVVRRYENLGTSVRRQD